MVSLAQKSRFYIYKYPTKKYVFSHIITGLRFVLTYISLKCQNKYFRVWHPRRQLSNELTFKDFRTT